MGNGYKIRKYEMLGGHVSTGGARGRYVIWLDELG